MLTRLVSRVQVKTDWAWTLKLVLTDFG